MMRIFKNLMIVVITALLIEGISACCPTEYKVKNDDVYKTKTINEIWSEEDKEQFVTDMYLYIANKCEYGLEMQNLNDKQRVIYITMNLEMEVNNGGFSQYFFNSGGNSGNELVDSFKKIGGDRTAQICKEAISIFPNAVPIDRKTRQKFLDSVDEEKGKRIEEILNKCDSDFYKYEENLAELNYQFILRNREDFSE